MEYVYKDKSKPLKRKLKLPWNRRRAIQKALNRRRYTYQRNAPFSKRKVKKLIKNKNQLRLKAP